MQYLLFLIALTQDARSELEQATHAQWERARADHDKRLARTRDVVAKDFPSLARTVDSRWDAALDAYATLLRSRPDFDPRPIDDLNAQFRSVWAAIDVERAQAALEREEWEDELDALNGIVDRLQSIADELRAADFERALERVEDGLEALDDAADEWDQRVGDDNDDFDDWDDGDVR
jgi:hypothetical protein